MSDDTSRLEKLLGKGVPKRAALHEMMGGDSCTTRSKGPAGPAGPAEQPKRRPRKTKRPKY